MTCNIRPLGSLLSLSVIALCFAVPSWSQSAPSGLTVKTATSKRVDLTWTGTAANYTVQRAPLGGAYINIASPTTASYSDTTIDPYTTYQYQIVAGTSAASNHVTVGPPPAGLTNVALAPVVGSDPSHNYGWDLSLALDGNGDPAFLFIWQDPNNDDDYTDTSLHFRSWNRAQYAWNPVVKIATVGDVASYFHSSASLAYDASTGVFAAASESGSTLGVDVYTSTDGGVTWSKKKTYQSTGESWGPSVALANGSLYMGYVVDYEGLKYVSGKESDASTWTVKDAPQPSGTTRATVGVAPSLALDSAGNPAIAYWVEDLNDGYNRIVLYWKPTSTGSNPVRVLDTQGRQSDEVAVRLAFYNLNPRVLIYGQRNDADFGVGDHYAQSSDGGITWQTPVVIPPDGNSSTDYPFDMAIGSQGQVAVAFGQNGGSGNDTCARPKLARSTDGLHFTTCAIAGPEVLTDFQGYPGAIQAAFGGNDKLFYLWWNDSGSPATTGVMMFREPPAGASTAPIITSVSDGASFRPNIVAGSWVTIKGANLADQTRIWADADFKNLGNALPTNLSGVQVKVNGVLAAIYYISSGQVNFQAPTGISGTVSVQAFFNGAASNTMTATAVSVAPALFTYAVGTTTYPAAVYSNGLIVGDPAVAGNVVAKAHTGDLIQLYGTGLATATGGTLITPFTVPTTVTATIGTATATVQYAGLTAVGEFQINIFVPNLAPGIYPVIISTAGQSSQTAVMIPVQ